MKESAAYEPIEERGESPSVMDMREVSVSVNESDTNVAGGPLHIGSAAPKPPLNFNIIGAAKLWELA